MTTRTPDPPTARTLLVLGATGDLAGRLLLPGLGGLLASERGRDLRLVGTGTEDWDDERWRERVAAAFAPAAGSAEAAEPAGAAEAVDPDAVEGPGSADDGEGGGSSRRRLRDTCAGATYLRADVTRPDDVARLLAACEPPVAIYFALPPAVTEAACAALEKVELPGDTRLVLEKPFGTDGEAARRLNELVGRLVPENQVFRVDHFLGKSTVLNILGLRFANRLLEPAWNAGHVERVDIVFDEQLALEGRARYYDGAGALEDMVQSHLLQVLALIAMDPPATLTARDLRDRKAEVLRATTLAGDPLIASRRARYGAGRVGERDLPAYADEDGVDPSRGTETLAEMVVEVGTWRWAGVPFRLRSGKALGRLRKEAVITFRTVPRLPLGLGGSPEPCRLRIGFGPDTLELELDVNGPGDPFEIERAVLSTPLAKGALSAYGEVLAGVLDGDPTLSVRGDTAEECWRIVEPVVAAFASGDVPLEEYPAGSDGPPSTATFPAV